MAACPAAVISRQSNRDTRAIPNSQSPSSSPPFLSGSAVLSYVPSETTTSTKNGMEMKKIACVVLVAASATVALAAEAPAPAPTSASAAFAPAVGAALGATVLSFFAYYLQ